VYSGLDLQVFKLTGPAGPTGPQGPAGSGGGGGPTQVFNSVSRYTMDGLAGQAVHCVSASAVFIGLTWSRVTTTLTINHIAHGRSVGDRVIVRNTNVDQLVALVTSVATDTYTVTCADSGATSGTLGAYSNGFTYAHDQSGSSIRFGTLTAPAGCDVQLMSLRIHLRTGTRLTTLYSVILPTSSLNGAGLDTNMDTIYIPNQQVRQDTDLMPSVGNTIATNISGSYATIQFGALPATTTGLHFLLQF
jgi:multisubunit Na+/H+ antiporter MnhF subunit